MLAWTAAITFLIPHTAFTNTINIGNLTLNADNKVAYVEWASGSKEWWFNGEYHRVDGPAMELANGRKEWRFHGEHYGSNDAFTNESWIAYVATLK